MKQEPPPRKWFRLPDAATAPFCPSEVRGSVNVPLDGPTWKKMLRFLGPGLLVSVGYMDPGNWATDIEAGSRYGYGLLFMILFSSLAAIALQLLSVRLGMVVGKDLARVTRDQYAPRTNRGLWLLAELAIIATDLAEVLGSALAFKLLIGCSLVTGILLTAFDTILILGLKGKGFRQVEAIVLGLIMTIGACYIVEIILLQPHWPSVLRGFIPEPSLLATREPWYLAIGILGATVMPHNLYLHSSVVQTRTVAPGEVARKEAIRLATLDTVLSLSLAFFVNAAILILAASAFHSTGHNQVTDIEDAHQLLAPITGSALAPILFGIALLAAGQSSTFTGTIAGQIIMEGSLDLKIPCWQRRLITRALALGPALLGVWWLGDHSVGRMLVLSQVLLSFQLPFAVFPLIRFNSDTDLMGRYALPLWGKLVAWGLFAIIAGSNLWLIAQVIWPAAKEA